MGVISVYFSVGNSFKEVSRINCYFGPLQYAFTSLLAFVEQVKKRAFDKQISEYYPVRLSKKEYKLIHNSILHYIINSDHTPSLETSFKIPYKVERICSKKVWMSILCTVEAITIHHFKFKLYIQNIHVQSLIFSTHPNFTSCTC